MTQNYSIGNNYNKNLNSNYLLANVPNLANYSNNSSIDVGNALNGSANTGNNVGSMTDNFDYGSLEALNSYQKQISQIQNQLASSNLNASTNEYSSQNYFSNLLDTNAMNSFNSLKAGGIGSTSGSTSNSTVNNASAGSYGGVNLNQTQVGNAKTIAETGASMGMSKRDIIIAIATAMQESQLGADCPADGSSKQDHDSVGIFQQRPSCGWGSVAQCEDPKYAATQFFNHLKKVSNRDSMSVTQAAQKVQVSAYPDAYAKWESMATALVSSLVS